MKALAFFGFLSLLLLGCGGGTLDSVQHLTLTPPAGSTQPGGQVQFTVDQAVQVDWTVPDGGTVVDGLFTAPFVNGTYRVVATHALNPFVSATALVTVADVQVTVSPEAISVAKGSVNPNIFTALVAGSANHAVTWSLDQTAAGTVVDGAPDGSGNARATYTAGNVAGTYLVRATSAADSSVSGVAQINVLGAGMLGINPRSSLITTTAPNNAVTLTAVLTDANGAVDSTTPLIWEVTLNPVGGTLSGSGLRQRTFTAPAGFVGSATCQVRVRTQQGLGAYATIYVKSG